MGGVIDVIHTEADVKCSLDTKWRGQKIAVVGFDGEAYSAKIITRMINCGKKGCTKCPHGPYYYARYRRAGRIYDKYLGKVK